MNVICDHIKYRIQILVTKHSFDGKTSNDKITKNKNENVTKVPSTRLHIQ